MVNVRRRNPAVLTTLAIACVVGFSLLNSPASGQGKHPLLKPEARMTAIRRAQVWTPTNVAEMDLKKGPEGPGAFAPNETVTCDYIDRKKTGASPKFYCRIGPGDEAKIKYGQNNGEVFGEIAATRLFWALGFGADREYPVRVICRGCPRNPTEGGKPVPGEVTFDYAALEREADGAKLEDKADSGWSFPELDLVEESAGGAPRAQTDALKLLAVFVQHTDSKAAQQRLLCLPEELATKDRDSCMHPFMMISDVGLTFGHANVWNRQSVGSVNFEQWSRTGIWTDDTKACVGHITRSHTGTLDHPKISEAGRKFLADLLVQLTDRQIHDLFEVARFPDRIGGGRQASVDEWTAVFKQKRDEIVNRTCPAS
jgi:hypothetical protein